MAGTDRSMGVYVLRTSVEGFTHIHTQAHAHTRTQSKKTQREGGRDKQEPETAVASGRGWEGWGTGVEGHLFLHYTLLYLLNVSQLHMLSIPI